MAHLVTVINATYGVRSFWHGPTECMGFFIPAFGRKIKLNLDSQLLEALTPLFFAPGTLSNVALR